MSKKSFFIPLAILVFAVVGLVTVHAQMPPPGAGGSPHGQFPPGVFGKVTAINGSTLTITSGRTTMTTYTVNASGATVKKNNAASSVSSIAVGDMVMVQGTVSGTSVTATSIMDGFGGRGGSFAGGHRPTGMSTSSMMMHRPTGTPPFGHYHNASSSLGSTTTASSSSSSFFGKITNFFRNLFRF